MVSQNKKQRLTKLFFLWIFLVLLLIFLGCIGYEIKNIHSRGKEIICFGNSITAGSNVSREDSFPHILSDLLGRPIINAGAGGDTSADGLRRLEDDILVYNPRLVIIEFGGNDFLSDIPLPETVSNIRIMTERIQAQGAMVAIVDVSMGMIMGNYRSSYRKLARQNQAIFIPNLLTGILNNPALKDDAIHPNVRGYRIVAEKIYKAIKPYLK